MVYDLNVKFNISHTVDNIHNGSFTCYTFVGSYIYTADSLHGCY